MGNLLSVLAAVLLLSAPLAGHAQLLDEPLQTVEVKAGRNRLVAYEESYQLAKKVQDASHGRVLLALRPMPGNAQVRLDDLEVTLEANGRSVPVPLRDGIVPVPVDAQLAAEGAYYFVNKQTADLTVNVVLLPALGRDEWTMGTIRRSIRDARLALASFIPWYQRPFAATVHTVSVCSAEAGAPVRVLDGEALVATLPTADKTSNDSGRPVFCHHFNGKEHYADSFRVAVPDGAEVLFY